MILEDFTSMMACEVGYGGLKVELVCRFGKEQGRLARPQGVYDLSSPQPPGLRSQYEKPSKLGPEQPFAWHL